MLELDTGYTFSQVPYLTYEVLEAYGEAVVRDFAPECLNNPTPLDVDRFLEYYLRLNVDYRRISHSKKILGMTVFYEGTVDVLNEETGQPEQMPVQTGTVIIDTSLTTKRNEARRRFTMMHEGGGHWLLHRKAFAQDNPFGPAGIYENQYLAAKEGRMDYSRSRREKTDIDLMERQADFLASVILMPRPALRVAYRRLFDCDGHKPRRIVRGTSPLDDAFARALPEYVAKTFQVSKRAALIRLEKLGAIVNKGWPYCHC
jgi:Zn-dependent peptidase ImmA (M78 family)